jgi:flagellin-like hook-associated protein FlgL
LDSGDFNGDGRDDLVGVNFGLGNVSVMLSQPGRTYSAPASLGPGSGAFGVTSSADLDGDGNLDLVIGTIAAGAPLGIYYGNGDGTFAGPNTIAMSVDFSPYATDLNGDGQAEVVLVSGSSLYVFGHSGARTFNAPQVYNLGIGSITALTFGDVNDDGNVDALVSNGTNIYNLIGNGDGTFESAVTAVSGIGARYTISLFEANGDGILDIAMPPAPGASYFAVAFGDAASSTSGSTSSTSLLSHIDLTSVSTALSALDSREQVLSGLTTVLGTIGAYQSRLQSVVRRLQGTSLEYDAARHRIVDADIAEESSKLIALTIRQQAATSLLAQANQIPALALKLLQK